MDCQRDINGHVPGGGVPAWSRMKTWVASTGQVIYDNQPRDCDYANSTTVIAAGAS